MKLSDNFYVLNFLFMRYIVFSSFPKSMFPPKNYTERKLTLYRKIHHMDMLHLCKCSGDGDEAWNGLFLYLDQNLKETRKDMVKPYLKVVRFKILYGIHHGRYIQCPPFIYIVQDSA